MKDFDSLLNRVFDIPEEIKEKELKKYGFVSKENSLINQDKKLKEKFYIEVCNEVGSEGKKLYTNDKMREIEADNRFLSSDSHKLFSEAIDKAQMEIFTLNVDIECLKREFKAIEMSIEINKSRVRFT